MPRRLFYAGGGHSRSLGLGERLSFCLFRPGRVDFAGGAASAVEPRAREVRVPDARGADLRLALGRGPARRDRRDRWQGAFRRRSRTRRRRSLGLHAARRGVPRLPHHLPRETVPLRSRRRVGGVRRAVPGGPAGLRLRRPGVRPARIRRLRPGERLFRAARQTASARWIRLRRLPGARRHPRDIPPRRA